jgi:glycosyltransferase involved in cell wall biosynthesis
MIGWEYPPFTVGGLGTHCYGLTRSLAHRGVKVDFYMPQTRHGSKSDTPNLTIKDIGETTVFPYDRPEDREIEGGFFDAVARYNALVASKVKGRYDVIHCHDWLTIQASIALKERRHLPMVLTIHSTEYDRSGGIHPNPWFIDIEKQGMDNADSIIAVSQATKRMMVEKYGIRPEKIRVIYNGVYPIVEGEKQKLVLFLGRLTIQKGADVFLRAAKKIIDFEPDVRFVVAGAGDLLPELIAQACALGISNRVMFAGHLTDKEMKYIYGVASVYVMPSVSEPFGITALEAMSAGTPTIASRTAGVCETFYHCLKVDCWDSDEIANKVISLLRYESLHASLSENGKREVGLFNWDGVAVKTLEVYTDLTVKRLQQQLAERERIYQLNSLSESC